MCDADPDCGVGDTSDESAHCVYQTLNNPMSEFICSEKATIFFEISTVDLSYVIKVKSTVEILRTSQNI